jgi:acetyl-CoA C-acetyltransferase
MKAGSAERRDVWVIDGLRTPFLKARGRPGPFSAVDMAVAAGRPLLMRQPFEPDAFDEVILGCAAPRPEESNPARYAGLRLGCGQRVPAWTVQRNCGSGMQSVDSAARAIADGRAELILAGGAESMSNAPLLVNRAMTEWFADWAQAKSMGARLKVLGGLRLGHFAPVISIMLGLTDSYVKLGMGQTAEILANRFALTREAMDAFALESHKRLARAQGDGTFQGEIEPVFDATGKAYDFDDGVRPENSMEQLAKLRPAFEPPHGKVTAGNSSQITDGGAWLILASDDVVKRYDLSPIARIVDGEWAGVDPAQMGLGPAHATAPLMARNGLALSDIDLFEINEAFAAQVLACLAALKDADYCRDEIGVDGAVGEIDPDRLNIDGGAISCGHPVGVSGTRIILHLIHALRKRGERRGIASLCIGGGQGGAVLVETA